MQQKERKRGRQINSDLEAKKLSEEFLVYAVFHLVLEVGRNNAVAYKPVQIHFYCSSFFFFFITNARAETINLSLQPWSPRACENGAIKEILKADTWQPVKISPFLKLNGLASVRMGDMGTIRRLLHYSCHDKPDGFKSQIFHTCVSCCSKQITLGPVKWNLSCPHCWDIFHSIISLRRKYLQLIQHFT